MWGRVLERKDLQKERALEIGAKGLPYSWQHRQQAWRECPEGWKLNHSEPTQGRELLSLPPARGASLALNQAFKRDQDGSCFGTRVKVRSDPP